VVAAWQRKKAAAWLGQKYRRHEAETKDGGGRSRSRTRLPTEMGKIMGKTRQLQRVEERTTEKPCGTRISTIPRSKNNGKTIRGNGKRGD